MYYDRLMNEGGALGWGICGVGVMPADRRMQQALDPQDRLYTLVTAHGDGTYAPRVIGSIVEYLFAPDDPEAVIEKMAAQATRIVSLTITEGGYNISDVTGEFDETNPDVVRDLRPHAVPQQRLGLSEALRRRRQRASLRSRSCAATICRGTATCASGVHDLRGLRDRSWRWVDREVELP